jgi:hypothetical protein
MNDASKTTAKKLGFVILGLSGFIVMFAPVFVYWNLIAVMALTGQNRVTAESVGQMATDWLKDLSNDFIIVGFAMIQVAIFSGFVVRTIAATNGDE